MFDKTSSGGAERRYGKNQNDHDHKIKVEPQTRNKTI